jgi:uncharacterized protein YqjF (DUF2071 family)
MSMTEILKRTTHRPWPLPAGPWIMAQKWHGLLFAHWRIDPAEVRRHIPAGLAIDTSRAKRGSASCRLR